MNAAALRLLKMVAPPRLELGTYRLSEGLTHNLSTKADSFTGLMDYRVLPMEIASTE